MRKSDNNYEMFYSINKEDSNRDRGRRIEREKRRK